MHEESQDLTQNGFVLSLTFSDFLLVLLVSCHTKLPHSLQVSLVKKTDCIVLGVIDFAEAMY